MKKHYQISEELVNLVALFRNLGVMTVFAHHGVYDHGTYHKAHIAFAGVDEYYTFIDNVNKHDDNVELNTIKTSINTLVSSLSQELWSRYAPELGKSVPSYILRFAPHERVELERLLTIYLEMLGEEK